MEKQSQNNFVSYEPVEAGSTGFSITFNRSVNDERTAVNGNVFSGGSKSGYVGYNSNDKKLVLTIENIPEDKVGYLPEILKTVAESVRDIVEDN